MFSNISAAARRTVIERARRRCEYCLIHEDSAGFPHQIDHVISRKHGGSSNIGNLAYACVFCILYKGSDVAGLDRLGQTVRLFNPRRDSWHEHFRIDGPIIQPLTAEGEVAARVLRLNALERVIERQLLQKLAIYPRE